MRDIFPLAAGKANLVGGGDPHGERGLLSEIVYCSHTHTPPRGLFCNRNIKVLLHIASKTLVPQSENRTINPLKKIQALKAQCGRQIMHLPALNMSMFKISRTMNMLDFHSVKLAPGNYDCRQINELTSK